MSIKYPFSPHGHHKGEPDSQQEPEGHDPQANPPESGPHHRQTAKGHAAYTSGDMGVPPAGPRGSGFGPIGGLFADDAAGPVGHGMQANNTENILASVSKEALQAECVARLCPDCPVKKEADDVRLRSLAELDNAKKRLGRERDEQIRFAAGNVLSDVIPSLDNLDLALQHAGSNEACKDLVVGIRMTRKLLFEALQKHGLELVGTEGESFDPAVHEAVGMADVPEVSDGHVCTLLSKGYKLKDRLLRPAQVVVCKRG